MDNAASRNPIPGEYPRAPAPTPQDVTPQSSGILGQGEEYKLGSEDDEIFNPRMTNFPNRFGPISRPNGPVQLSSRGIFNPRMTNFPNRFGPISRPNGPVQVSSRGIFNPGMTNFPNRFGPISRPNGPVQLSTRGIFNPGMTNFPNRFGPIFRPNGPVQLSSRGIFNPGMRNFPHRFGPISRPNGPVQLSSSGIMPPVVSDAPENTRISEDVTQTTGLKSSASKSTEVRTSVESIPDRSHETVNSVSTEAGERKESSNEMTPMSPSESLPWGISANPALQMVRPRFTEIVQEEKEGREPEPSLRRRRSLGRNN